jgi:hypothetical protein
MTVYVLQHPHLLPGEVEDIKLLGVYASEADALAAVSRFRLQPGFQDFPKIVNPLVDDDLQGFHLDAYVLNQDHWQEGLVTVFHPPK